MNQKKKKHLIKLLLHKNNVCSLRNMLSMSKRKCVPSQFNTVVHELDTSSFGPS